MTVFIRDLSDYDSNTDLTGFVGATHKATEGTTTQHVNYGARLNWWRGQGVKVLGAYHVVRTPGSGGAGSLQAQVDYWFARMDAQTPWWRTFPGFILQIDAEKWSYDPVSAATVKAFAALVKAQAPADRWVVTYASRGQYGDTLTGIVTPLWNAAYRSSSYPGDGSTDWAPYSGRTPTFWQYTSTPFDKNAFRGSLDELLTLIGGNTMADTDIPDTHRLAGNADTWGRALVTGENPAKYLGWGATDPNYSSTKNVLHDKLDTLVAAAAADQQRDAAMLAAIQTLSAGGTSIDTTAVINAINATAAAESQAVAALQADNAKLRSQLAAALSAAGQSLAS